MAGVLVLVVGPSGSGKDTLIGRAKAALVDDPRYSFPRRIVTRKAIAALEDHDSVELEEFQRQKQFGAYALDWEAHGLHYALPAAIDTALAAGRTIVANVSRRVIPRAQQAYERCEVLLITAPPATRAARLATRGRETEAEVAARLAREGDALPADVVQTIIDNSGDLEDSLHSFLAALARAAG